MLPWRGQAHSPPPYLGPGDCFPLPRPRASDGGAEGSVGARGTAWLGQTDARRCWALSLAFASIPGRPDTAICSDLTQLCMNGRPALASHKPEIKEGVCGCP